MSDTEKMIIPEAAVEAAARALYPEVREEWRVPPDPWESIPEDDDAKIEAIALARIALEAAAPHLFAPALALADEMDNVHGSIRGHVTTYQLRKALGVTDE